MEIPQHEEGVAPKVSVKGGVQSVKGEQQLLKLSPAMVLSGMHL